MRAVRRGEDISRTASGVSSKDLISACPESPKGMSATGIGSDGRSVGFVKKLCSANGVTALCGTGFFIAENIIRALASCFCGR